MAFRDVTIQNFSNVLRVFQEMPYTCCRANKVLWQCLYGSGTCVFGNDQHLSSQYYVTVLAAGSFQPVLENVAVSEECTVDDVVSLLRQLATDDASTPDSHNAREAALFHKDDVDFATRLQGPSRVFHTNTAKHATFVVVRWVNKWDRKLGSIPIDNTLYSHKGMAWNPRHTHILAIWVGFKVFVCDVLAQTMIDCAWERDKTHKNYLSWDDTGRYLSYVAWCTMFVWDMDTRTNVYRYHSNRPTNIYCIAWAPSALQRIGSKAWWSKHHFAKTERNPKYGRFMGILSTLRLEIWNVTKQQRVHKIQFRCNNRGNTILWHPTKPLLIFTQAMSTIRIWDAQTFTFTKKIKFHEKYPKLYSLYVHVCPTWDWTHEDRPRLSVCSRDEAGFIFDLDLNNQTLTRKGVVFNTHRPAWNFRHNLVADIHGEAVRFRQVSSIRPCHKLDFKDKKPRVVKWSHDQQYFAVLFDASVDVFGKS